jgi:hypothetical protein
MMKEQTSVDLKPSRNGTSHEPLVPSNMALLIAAGLPVLLLETWIVLTIDDGTVKLLLLVGVLLSSGCALLAGNTYRAFDTRRRWVREVNGGLRPRQALLGLPVLETLSTRLRFAVAGVTLGLLITVGVAAAWSAAGGTGDALALAVLGVVVALICGVIGTCTRPID